MQQILRETACRSFSFHALTPIAKLLQEIPRPSGRKALPAWAEPLLDKLQKGEAIDGKKTADALGALLAGLAPVVLHLEDIHEASPERLELIQDLAQMVARGRGVALLVTGRTEPPTPFEAVRLEPLNQENAGILLEAEVGTSLPQEALEWIYRHALGNPLFTIEYLCYLARQGFLWSDGNRWRWRQPPQGTVPITIEALIERVLHQVSANPTVRAALAARALLPRETDESLWARVTGVSAEELSKVQAQLEEQGVLQSGDFSHPLYREVVARSLSPHERREIARQALEALSDENPRAAAEFVQEAGLDPKAAMNLLSRAVQSAKEAGNVLQVARLQARMAEYAGPEERGQLALEAAQILQHHDLHQASRLTAMVLQTPGANPKAVYFHAHLLARQGRFPDLQGLLAGLPPPLQNQIDLNALLISTHNIAGNHHAALEIWNAHPELHPDPTPELLRAVAASALASGQMEQAKMLCAKGLGQAPTLALRCEFLSIQALITYHQGDSLAAEATLAQAIDFLSTLDAPRLLSTALVNRAAFLRMLSRYTEMGQCLEQALEIRRQVGDAKGYAFALAALSELLVEQGHYERAEEAIAEAIHTLQPYGPSRYLTNAHSMASLLYSAQDTPISKLLALKQAETALGYARQIGSPRVVREILFDASVANVRSGYTQRGMDLATEAQTLAEAAGNSPHDNFRTLWARGLALEAWGERSEATQVLQQALELARPLKVAIDEHKLGLELDRITRNLENARDRLAWFEAHGLMNGVHIAQRYFPELAGVSTPKKIHQKSLPRLEVLGLMQISQAGEIGKSEAVRGQKRKELLSALLETRIAGRAEVSTLELIEALYPGIPDEEASDALKQTVFKTRSSLGQSLIATTASGYALGDVESDAELFLKSGQTALWRGVYLQELSPLDETVSDALYHALSDKAKTLLQTDPREAARLGRILMEADPYSLEALRLTCQALRQSDNHRSLARLYEQARVQFQAVGEALPTDWAAFLEQVAA